MTIYCVLCIHRWGPLVRKEWNLADTLVDGTAICAVCIDWDKVKV